MRSFRANPAILIAALLGLLLLIYVFAGSGREPRTAQTRCTTREAYDQINRELFRRAAALRPNNESALRQVAAYSVVRRNSQVRRRSEKSGAVNCSGSIALDLPPGVAGSGGQHSLTANVAYVLAPASGRKVELRSLSNVDPMVQQLAELVAGPGQTQPPAPTQPDMATSSDDSANAADALPPAPPPPVQQTEPRQVRPPAPPPSPPRTQSTAPRRPAVKAPPAAAKPPRPAPKPQTAKAAPRPDVRAPTPAAPPPRAAAASPSFNCRYARTRGEVAVCRDPGLASLDRQMANQFNRALSRASPGAKLILQRSRTRFLKYRDSCTSDACVAGAYQGRINEIDDIATRY